MKLGRLLTTRLRKAASNLSPSSRPASRGTADGLSPLRSLRREDELTISPIHDDPVTVPNFPRKETTANWSLQLFLNRAFQWPRAINWVITFAREMRRRHKRQFDTDVSFRQA